MVDWDSIAVLIGAGLGAAVAAYFGYSKKWPDKPQQDPVLAGIGLELGNREQGDRLITEVAGIRKAVETIADRKQNDMQDTLEEIVEQLKPKPRARRTRKARTS